MEYLQKINAWFWTDNVWLPPNVTWNDISDTSTVNYAQFSDLNNGFKVALALLVVRFILERYIFSPIGIYLGLKPKHLRKVKYDATENKLLEKALSKNGKIDYKQVQGLAKQLDWSERRVERLIRRRLLHGKPSTLSKFTESAWRFTFYLCSFSYGFYISWDKPWLWNTYYCWYDYPHHSVADDVWWHYMLELGFYWSLIISQFIDTKRKDFLQMFLHHIATIALLTFSWTLNLFRVGSLVVVLHDFADVPLEAAKLARYVENQRMTESCFVVFMIAWVISRLVVFPYWIIHDVYEAFQAVAMLPVCFLFLLLCGLQILHIVWTWIIFKIALHAISSKNPEIKDLRSDSEESNESDSEN